MKKSIQKILLASLIAIGSITTVCNVNAASLPEGSRSDKGIVIKLKLDKEEVDRLKAAGIKINREEIANALMKGGDLTKYKDILDKEDLTEIENLVKRYNMSEQQKKVLMNAKIMDEFADDIEIFIDGKKVDVKSKFEELEDKYERDNGND